jgi:hypothetical protein
MQRRNENMVKNRYNSIYHKFVKYIKSRENSYQTIENFIGSLHCDHSTQNNAEFQLK